MSTAEAVTIATAPTPPFTFTDPAFRADPYPFYARMRREMPIFRMKNGRRGDGFYVTRYDDVMALMRDTGRFANDKRNAGHAVSRLESMLSMGIYQTVVMQDGADHRRLRNLVHKAFTPSRVASLEGRIQQITEGLLDAAEAQDAPDLIETLALPLPLTVISEMMGVEPRDQGSFHVWMKGMLELDSAGSLELLANAPNLFRLHRFLRRLIDERRHRKGDDLLSAMVAAEEEGDRLSFDELVAATFILLLAGHETTVNLIGNGMLALIEHPHELERLRAEPALMDSAVEELLRFTNPVQINAPRYVLQDTELCGVPVPRGAAISPILGSANRDEAHFPDPDRLDIARQPNRHVAFGFGPHYCLGAALARLEAKAAFSAMLQRYRSIELAVPRSDLVWRRSLSVRGLTRLPLRLAR